VARPKKTAKASIKTKAPAKRATKAPAKRATKAPAKRATKAPANAAEPRYATRRDLGKPVDGFFAKVKEPLRAVVDELRTMIQRAAPDARASIKWGMPFYEIDGNTVCAVAVHKAHVNLILAGPPGTFSDPDGLLSGEGKTGRHLKVTSASALPRDSVRKWLATAVALARNA
jgi:hypothetical protein